MPLYKKIFLFILVLFSLRLFDAHFLDKSLVNYLVFVTLLFTVVISLPFFMIKGEGFILPVQLIIFSIIVSVFMASLSWYQSLKDSIIETVPYLLWILFFYLLHEKVPIRLIEKIVLIYGAVYVLLYFYQLSQSPNVLFGQSLWGDEFSEDRGTVRIIFPGAGVFILSVFISINKLTSRAKGKVVWLSFLVLGLVIPVLQVTRQFIVGMLLVYLFHFLKGQGFLKKLVVITAVVGIVLYVNSLDSPLIKGLKDAADEDLKQGGEYVRVMAGKFFLTDFSPDTINQILGNGAPYWGFSFYGIYVANLAEQHGYFLSDVGIIGMYAMFGVFAIVGYIMIWIKSFTIPVPKDYYYLKYYLWYLLFTSLTWYSVYHYSYMIATVFVIYIYQKVSQKTQSMYAVKVSLQHQKNSKVSEVYNS